MVAAPEDHLVVQLLQRTSRDQSLTQAGADYFDKLMFLVDSPEYLAEQVRPGKPSDLVHHNCLIYSRLDCVNHWHFTRKGRDYPVTVTGSLQCDNGDALLESAVAGLGLIVLPHWMIHSQLASGALETVMEEYLPPPLPIHVVYPQRRHLPLKVRCFVDFIAGQFADNPVLL